MNKNLRSEQLSIIYSLMGKIHWNRLVHIFMIPFMTEKCWQALSSINATLSSSLLSSLLPTTHPKDCIRYWRSVLNALHSSNQWKMSSTFPDSHWRQVLSSLCSPCHRPHSTPKGAVSPLNTIISLLWLLLATCQHRDSVLFILNIRNVPSFGLVSIPILLG
jgi:hypothetical protein